MCSQVDLILIAKIDFSLIAEGHGGVRSAFSHGRTQYASRTLTFSYSDGKK